MSEEKFTKPMSHLRLGAVNVLGFVAAANSLGMAVVIVVDLLQ
jgi:hypothetical protein